MAQNSPRILIISDDLSSSSLPEMLINQNYRVEQVHNQYDIVNIVQTIRSDLIIIDLDSNADSAFQTLNELKHDTAASSIPILAISRQEDYEQINLAYDMGVDEYVLSPTDLATLLPRIKNMVTDQDRVSLRKRTRELQMLLRITEELNRRLEFDELMVIVPHLVLDLSHSEVCLLYHLESDMKIAHYAGFSKNGDMNAYAVDEEMILQNILNKKKSNLSTSQNDLIRQFLYFIATPLFYNNDLLGFIIVFSNQRYTKHDLDLLEAVGKQVALTFNNTTLYELQAQYARQLEEMVEERTMQLQSTQELLFRADKMASVGRLAAGIAHEINNPLMPILINLEHMREDVEQGIPVHVQDIQETMESAKRISRVVENLLTFTRKRNAEAPDLELLDLIEVLDTVITLSEKMMLKNRIRIEKQTTCESCIIYGNRDQLEQVFLNLFLNAQQAMTKGGTLRIGIVATGDYYVVSVNDNGIGIEERMIDQIFEPFVTTKDKGTGLGLFVAYNIIQNHNGFIEAESKRGRGTTFKIRIPKPESNA